MRGTAGINTPPSQKTKDFKEWSPVQGYDRWCLMLAVKLSVAQCKGPGEGDPAHFLSMNLSINDLMVAI